MSSGSLLGGMKRTGLKLLKGQQKEVFGPGLLATLTLFLWWRIWAPVLAIIALVVVAPRIGLLIGYVAVILQLVGPDISILKRGSANE